MAGISVLQKRANREVIVDRWIEEEKFKQRAVLLEEFNQMLIQFDSKIDLLLTITKSN